MTRNFLLFATVILMAPVVAQPPTYTEPIHDEDAVIYDFGTGPLPLTVALRWASDALKMPVQTPSSLRHPGLSVIGKVRVERSKVGLFWHQLLRGDGLALLESGVGGSPFLRASSIELPDALRLSGHFVSPSKLEPYRHRYGLILRTFVPLNNSGTQSALYRSTPRGGLTPVLITPQQNPDGLLVEGFAPEVCSTVDLIRDADRVDGDQALKTRIFSVTHVEAAEAAGLLRAWLSTDASPMVRQQGAQGPTTPTPASLQLVADPQRNRILARGSIAQLEECAAALKSLDTPSPSK